MMLMKRKWLYEIICRACFLVAALCASVFVYRIQVRDGKPDMESKNSDMAALEEREGEEDPYFYVEGDMELLRKYQDYNEDVVGLIRIPDTVLNHPLVHTPEKEEYYLLRDLDGNYNSHGVPFLSKDSRMEKSDNVIVFGHNIHLRTRDIFADLAGYEDLTFYKEHPLIETVSKSGTRRWLIFAYFLVDNADEEPFRYSEVTSFPSLEKYEAFFREVEKRNWLSVPIKRSIEDRYLTLSSCSNELAGSGTNRMVVIARELGVGESYQDIVDSAVMVDFPMLPKRLQ